MRVLVTGSAGFIGAHTVRELERHGHDVRGLDLKAAAAKDRVDLSVGAAVSRAVQAFRPACVVHLGALASVPGCEDDPEACVRVNVLGTWNVAKAASREGARVVFASTAAVYGDGAPLPTPVSTPARPTNLYGISKLSGEKIVETYVRDSVALRLFNVYGPGCDRSYVIPDLIRRLRKGPKEIVMQGTGRETRDFVYVGDVVDALTLSVTRPIHGAYNVGSGVRTRISEVARALVRTMGLRPLPIRFKGARRGDFRANHADLSGSNRPPGWKPKVSLAVGLRRTVAGTR